MMQATWRKTVTHTTEYLLPAGACVGELLKAIRVAWASYCTETGTSADANMPDDWAVVTFDDEHVIIGFQTRKEVAR